MTFAFFWSVAVNSVYKLQFFYIYQHILGYLVPYDSENVIKMWRYNQSYLATINVK